MSLGGRGRRDMEDRKRAGGRAEGHILRISASSDHYTVLGVARDASDAEVKKSYRFVAITNPHDGAHATHTNQ